MKRDASHSKPYVRFALLAGKERLSKAENSSERRKNGGVIPILTVIRWVEVNAKGRSSNQNELWANLSL